MRASVKIVFPFVGAAEQCRDAARAPPGYWQLFGHRTTKSTQQGSVCDSENTGRTLSTAEVIEGPEASRKPYSTISFYSE